VAQAPLIDPSPGPRAGRELLARLRCPDCGGLLAPTTEGDKASSLTCSACVARFPVQDGIPRFVPEAEGPDHFGAQWTLFARTQLDSASGQPISRDRFLRFTGWSSDDLRGKDVLDAGCGAGRFAEIALALGARVVAVDASAAVDACRRNLGSHPGLDVVQADLYRLPFVPGSFDFVYCLGVLQHTPDVERAFKALPRQLRRGGRLAVDLYPRLWRNLLWPKYWLRPLTRRLSPPALHALVSRAFPVLYPVSQVLGRLPLVGRQLRYAVPVANYEGVLPLTPAQLREWALLDTLDMLGPRYDQPQSASTLRRWFEEAGLEDIHVSRMGFLVGTGCRA
jgi:SAM-dependent methyltransferase